MKRNHLLGAILLIICAGVFFMNCSKGSSSSSGGGYTTPPPTGGTGGTTSNSVNMASMSFGPTSLTVKVGATVTWTNNDSYTHTVTADDNGFNSGDMASGASFTHTFTVAGTYNYHCIYHSMMVAKNCGAITIKQRGEGIAG